MRRILAAYMNNVIIGSALVLGVAAALPARADSGTTSPAPVRTTDSTDTSPPSLKDTLDAGLKARLPQEFAFVDRVVRMVDRGRLPRDMVQSTFLWARKKRFHQMQYFEHGLRVRAEEIGVRL